MRCTLAITVFLVLLSGNLILFPFNEALAATPDQVASFRKLWARTDDLLDSGVVSRTWVWGPKALDYDFKDKYRFNISSAFQERAFRFYDKGRMEIDPRAAPGSKWYIRGGALVKEMVSGMLQIGEDGETGYTNPIAVSTPADIPVVGDATLNENTPTYGTFTAYSSVSGVKAPDRRGQSVTKLINRTADTVFYNSNDPKAQIDTFEAATGHNIPRAFTEFFNRQGLVKDANGNKVTEPLFDPVFLFGYPITEPYWAKVPVAGKPTLVLLQLFERRVLSYTPSNAPDWQVEMGNDGAHYLAWRAQNSLTFSGPPRITLDQFRNTLQYYRSPVISEATDLYNSILGFNLDPAVALAFFVRESGAGTAVGYCNGQNSLNNKNWGNVRGDEQGVCGFQAYPTWSAGLDHWCRLMVKYYVNRGLNHIEDAIPVYAPASDGNDPREYINTMYNLVFKWKGYRTA